MQLLTTHVRSCLVLGETRWQPRIWGKSSERTKGSRDAECASANRPPSLRHSPPLVYSQLCRRKTQHASSSSTSFSVLVHLLTRVVIPPNVSIYTCENSVLIRRLCQLGGTFEVIVRSVPCCCVRKAWWRGIKCG